MQMSIVVWDLHDSEQTVSSLREYLSGYATEAYAALEGLHLKAWFSNEERQIWGAVYLWDDVSHMNGPHAISHAIELIGYRPKSVGVFDVEALAEGRTSITDRTRVGLAFEDCG